jgi:predicted nucleotidyltransferase
MKQLKYNVEANLHMLQTIAEKLEGLREQIVFVGGCATALLITDPAAPDVRQTVDVDCIVDVVAHSDYRNIEKQLRGLGFYQSVEDAVICRWRVKGQSFYLDIMPTDETILGFSNVWYKLAVSEANQVRLKNDISIRLISPPYFLATKLEAFKGRGKEDYLASHDLEDVISVIDGRPELIDDIKKSGERIKTFLAAEFTNLINIERFREALPGHLYNSPPGSERVVVERILEITNLEKNILPK